MEAIKKRLLIQAGICSAIFAAMTMFVMFSSKSHLGFFGDIAVLVFGSAFTTIGVAIGDAIRRFVKPDLIFASSAIDIFRTKVFWLIGPQLIGWIIGFMAFNGFMANTLGYDMRNGRPRVSQSSETAPQPAVVRPLDIAQASSHPAVTAQGQEAQRPESAQALVDSPVPISASSEQRAETQATAPQLAVPAVAPAQQPVQQATVSGSDNPLDALSGGDAFTLNPTGTWHGYTTYHYKFTSVRGDIDMTFPVKIDGHVFNDPLELASAVSEIDEDRQHAPDMSCNVFCWNTAGVLLGYTPAGYGALTKGRNKS